MKKSTALEFIEKALIIHGDKYGYDAVEYLNNKYPVRIWCNIHNEYFEQTPNSHLKGNGCPKCGDDRTKNSILLSTDTFLKRAFEVHGDLYDYSKSEYLGAEKPIIITCKIHGDFVTRARVHIRGAGCPICLNESFSLRYRDSKEQFIEKARAIHGDKYDYSLSEYKNQATKIAIVCKIHGIFYQKPNLHLSSKCGCPECGIGKGMWTYSAWERVATESAHFDGFKLYVLKCWNDDEVFYKIGKTFKPIALRFYPRSFMPYEYEVIKVIEGTARHISELEQELQNKHTELSYKPKIGFYGQTECFTQYLE